MRIIIQNGSSEFVLCGGILENEHVETWDEDSDELVQEEPFIRAVRRKYFPRGNTGTVVLFSLSKEHADAQACEEYTPFLHRSIPKFGTFIFISEGTGQSRMTLTDACLKTTGRTRIGCRSILNYRLLGGDFTEAT